MTAPDHGRPDKVAGGAAEKHQIATVPDNLHQLGCVGSAGADHIHAFITPTTATAF
jgi:hypothetical protein